VHSGDKRRAVVRDAVEQLEHVLPAQAPIRDFVHHNTLHGFQHLPFREAVVAAARRIGARGFLRLDQFRSHYQRGRIDASDLHAALRDTPELEARLLLEPELNGLRRADVYLAALLHDLNPISPAHLRFQIEELRCLERVQAEVSPRARGRLLQGAQAGEPDALRDLWSACLETLGVEYKSLHPEELARADAAALSEARPKIESHAVALLEATMARVGEDWTLRELMRSLTGEDLMTNLRPGLLRHLGSHLDQGLAPWHNPARDKGFYRAWRASVDADLGWGLIDLSEWRRIVARLPEEAIDTVIEQLSLLGIPERKWADYLERLSLELPGWSGMFLWRANHPAYGGLAGIPIDLMDYLAVRLVLERLFAHGMCRRRWQIEPDLAAIRRYFQQHPAELLVRHALYNERLPEHLMTLARGLTQHATFSIEQLTDEAWQEAAERMEAWRHRAPDSRAQEVSAHASAWPLFLLCQHLGVSGRELSNAGAVAARGLLQCLQRVDEDTAGYVWLLAYERHYREQIFGALLANHGRGQRRHPSAVPEAQLVFCMDDREEGMRRNLEEINPDLETFGAAGFFGIAVNWRGLDDTSITPLCPIVVTPSHEAREVPQPGAEDTNAMHRRRRAIRLGWKQRLYEGTRRDLLSSTIVLAAAAPATLAALTAKVLAPSRIGRLGSQLRASFDIGVPTRVEFEAPADSPPATPQQPRFGFTDVEQADRVQGLLRTIGLTSGFSPLIAVFGHGSSSENNPHMAAYDCGACSGRHGGPNARLFAAMANRQAVRAILAERGLVIPDTTWFLGGQRNTSTSAVTWFDRDALPTTHETVLAKLDAELLEAARNHARERCRRFASAPRAPSLLQAHGHVIERSFDFSQARPELGHATNAAAFIGRRSMSRGAFFDRRTFLISYDPTQDPGGKVVEAILLAAGPVGAGISLEYYFSTVNNERYGCGTKVVHNVTGLFGVMEGAGSDLRTGLPLQMIEIHEAMRLLIVVEHRTEVLDAICERQPALQELIGNGWVQLAAKHPEGAEISFHEPGRGWQRWEPGAEPPPLVECSADWFMGHTEALPPALLARS
jgi:uncharacterized protein YbcC (UPF0753/DUF2309 family)